MYMCDVSVVDIYIYLVYLMCLTKCVWLTYIGISTSLLPDGSRKNRK